MILTKARLEEVLRGLGWPDLEIQYEPVSKVTLVPILISTQFEGLDEAERKQILWTHLFNHLTLDETADIEFTFAMTPDEFYGEGSQGEEAPSSGSAAEAGREAG